MTVCTICGGTEFESHGGHYYCIECNTQTQEIRDLEVDEGAEYEGFQASLFLTTNKSTKDRRKRGATFGDTWISHEAYNVIICQQVKSLIKIGASPKLKDVVLQLWASYLKKNEVAFKEESSNLNNWEPCLGAFPRKRDVQVLTGETEICYRKKTLKKKKEKERRKTDEKNVAGSEMQVDAADTITDDVAMQVDIVEDIIASQVERADDNSQKDHEESNDTSITYKKKKNSELVESRVAKRLQRKQGKKTLEALPPQVRETYSEFMSLPKTLCFCYLGLLLLKEEILLCDIIRFAIEGHFPYMDATHHMPDSMELQDGDWAVFTPAAPPNLKKIVSLSTQLAMFIGVPKLPSRPLLPIAVRFIKDLGLPDNLITVVKILLEGHPSPGPSIALKKTRSNKVVIPIYEVEAMAHVLVAVKLVFGLDGKTERKLSRFANEKNKKDSNLNYFVWDEWMANIKLKQLFLRSRNIPYFYNHDHALDVGMIYCNYFDVLKSWTPKTSIAKKKHRYAQPGFRNEVKKVFSETFTKSDNNNQLLCPASSFPLKSRLRQQVNLLCDCHQYSLSQVNSISLLKNFSHCSLSFIFNYWSRHKSKGKSKRKSRALAQHPKTECNYDFHEEPDDCCAETDALESEKTETSSRNELTVNGTEGHTKPSKKRKRDNEGHTETSTKKKHDKHSEVKIHKKKSQTGENAADCESENVKDMEKDKSADVKSPKSKKREKNPAAKTSKNSKKSTKQKISKTGGKIKNIKKKKKGKRKKEGKSNGRKSQVFSKNYWYVKCALRKIQQACDKFPETFKWLLRFASEMIETDIDVLYREILIIEQRLFKRKLKSK